MVTDNTQCNTGADSLWVDENGNILTDSEGVALRGPPVGWNLVFDLPSRPEWPLIKVRISH